MKLLGVISTSALLLLLGAAVPAYAQEEHHEQEAKPEKQEQKAKPEKQEQKAQPEKQEQKAQPAKQQEPAKTAKQEEPAKTEKQAQAAKQEPENKNVKQEEARKPAAQQQQHVQHSAAEEKRQRSEPALRLSVRGSGRIPEERFHANFGREHNFRIGAPVLVGGYSRFQYSGFWFGFVEPWPVAWYYTDDVYVDYIDGGYYLINPSYPEARISISVVI